MRGVRSIWETADGELRAVTPDGKFHQLAGENFVSAESNLPGGTTFDFPQNVIQDSFGEIWAATKNGLFRFPNIAELSDLQKAAPQKGFPNFFRPFHRRNLPPTAALVEPVSVSRSRGG